MNTRLSIDFLLGLNSSQFVSNHFIKTIGVMMVAILSSISGNAQVTIFSEDFETATGVENQVPYLGWQGAQFATTPPTNDNYWWVLDNTRCNVITGTHSMAVSQNNPATSGIIPQYKTNKPASTLAYYATPIDATGYTGLTLDFNWICEGEIGFDYGTVLYSLDGNTWAALPGFYEGQSTVQTVTNLDLSVVDGQQFYLGFGWDNDNSVGGFPGFIVDDIVVKGIQFTPCTTPNPPTALSLAASGDTVFGSFTAAAPAPTGYLVIVSTSNVPPSPVNGTNYTIGSTIGAGYTVADNDANTSFTATGLNPGTTYYIYVFSYNGNCLGGPYYSSTPLSGSSTTTNSTYCTPTTSNSRSYRYINDIQFIGTLNDVSNLGNSYFQPNVATCALSTAQSGYQNWTCRPKSIQAQGEGVNIYVGCNTGRGRYKAWVDWNKDGVFDNTTELVYNTGGVLTATTTFGFVIPANQPIGDYRIRIRFHAAFGNSGAELGGAYNFTPCQNFGSGGGQNHYGEAEDYLFTVVQSCPAKISSVTDGSTCGPGPATLQAVSAGATQFRWYDAKTGGNLVATTATGTWSPIISSTTVYWVTAYDGSCESLVRTKIVATLNPITELTITPEFPTVCGDDDIIEISATGDTEIAYLIDEDFEGGGTGVFSVVNLIDNGAAINNLTRWQNRTSTFVPNQLVWKPAISSGISGNRFLSATSDVNPPTGYVYTSLESPVLDSSTFTDLTLNFDMYFSKYLTGLDPDYVLIYASIDGGTNWTLVQSYLDDVGYGTSFNNLTVDMSAYINQPNLKISIDYYAIWADGAAVDNIQLFGSKPLVPSFTWTGTVDAYTDAATTIPYTAGTPIGTVYVKPTLAQLELPTFTFTANATLSNGCTVSKDITITNNTKIWQGLSSDWNSVSNWKPSGVPTNQSCVIIGNQPNAAIIDNSTDGDAYNLKVLNGGSLTVQPSGSITVQDLVTVDTGGTFLLDGFEHDSGSLIQVNDVTNIGDIILKRATNVRRQDYVYWSSPVQNYSVTDISPTTSSGLIFEWDPTVPRPPGPPPNNNPNDYGTWINASGNMVTAKGYIIRGPNGFSNATAAWYTAQFEGVPNNGDISIQIERGTYTGSNYVDQGGVVTRDDDNWNLVGNPYPSAIDANVFLSNSANSVIEGTVYLWTHGTRIQQGFGSPFYGNYTYNYNISDYLEYNLSGPSTQSGFNGYIGSGQGFFVLMEDAPDAGTSEPLTFNNTMRDRGNDNDQFFRIESTSQNTTLRDRIWLDLVTPEGETSTTLVAYVEGATNGNDRLYDARTIGGSGKSLYSILEDERLIIQGRNYPLDVNDVVNIGFTTEETGTFVFAIHGLDGIFETSNQDIFLEDLELNVVHDLKANPYTFSIDEAGSYDSRFVLRYTNETLDIINTQLHGFDIVAGKDFIKVTSEITPIKEVVVYDILGRILLYYSNVNSQELISPLPNQSRGTLVVKATLEDGRQKIKKAVF